MPVSKDQTEYVARLARLGLSEEEKDLFTGQLNSILGYVEMVNSLDTKDISPTAYTGRKGKLTTPMREDKVEKFGNIAGIMNNAPVAEDNMFRVPKILEEEV